MARKWKDGDEYQKNPHIAGTKNPSKVDFGADRIQYFDNIISSIKNFLIVVDANYYIKLINKSALNILHYKQEDILDEPLACLMSDKAVSTDIAKKIIEDKSVKDLEIGLMTKEGRKIPVLFSATPIKDEDGEIIDIVCVAQDITNLKKVERNLLRITYTDLLTRLPNRLKFINIINDEIESHTEKNAKFAICILSITNFKIINESQGREFGDSILKQAADRISLHLKNDDIVARTGGSEYSVLLKDAGDQKDTENLINTLLNKMSEPVFHGRRKVYLNIAIGVSFYPDHSDTSEGLRKFADLALDKSKEQTKNNYQFFSSTFGDRYKREMDLENALYTAIESDQLSLQFQPQFALPSEKLIGTEVLVRWNHPKYGCVSPAEFIPLAEKGGLIIAIGTWIFKQACIQLAEWQKEFEFASHFKLAINVSPVQLIQEEFPSLIKNILRNTTVKPENLEIEVTETMMMAYFSGTSRALDQLNETGLILSIDDFGVGHSSLGRIKDLPIKTLKIDASFVRNVHKNENNQAIIKAILALAKSLELNVIAEGAEIREEVDFLIENGCPQVQGFYFSKPIDAEGLFELFKTKL